MLEPMRAFLPDPEGLRAPRESPLRARCMCSHSSGETSLNAKGSHNSPECFGCAGPKLVTMMVLLFVCIGVAKWKAVRAGPGGAGL